MIKTANTFLDNRIRYIRYLEKAGEFVPIDNSIGYQERNRRLRKNYALQEKLADEGLSCWMHGDPYNIADWCSMFTPIEEALWNDLRTLPETIWPQYPIRDIVVDFANPFAQFVIECDGKLWHQDKQKDYKRDYILMKQGWTVYRFPGWACNFDYSGLIDEYHNNREHYIANGKKHTIIDYSLNRFNNMHIAGNLEKCKKNGEDMDNPYELLFKEIRMRLETYSNRYCTCNTGVDLLSMF